VDQPGGIARIALDDARMAVAVEATPMPALKSRKRLPSTSLDHGALSALGHQRVAPRIGGGQHLAIPRDDGARARTGAKRGDNVRQTRAGAAFLAGMETLLWELNGRNNQAGTSRSQTTQAGMRQAGSPSSF